MQNPSSCEAVQSARSPQVGLKFPLTTSSLPNSGGFIGGGHTHVLNDEIPVWPMVAPIDSPLPSKLAEVPNQLFERIPHSLDVYMAVGLVTGASAV